MVFDKRVIDDCFKIGLMGIMIPEEFGGFGGTFFQAVLAIEEVARLNHSVTVRVEVQTTLVENLLLRWAGDEQKQALLPRMASDTIGAYFLSETGSGSDAFAVDSCS